MESKRIWILVLFQFLIFCKPAQVEPPKLFSLLPSSLTHIDFINKLDFDKDFNVYTYRNFYNGGGVALGDINNDGLIDIYLSANMKENKLYLNKGNFQFEDITKKANVAGTRAWSTGVSFADVNGDGWLDIYVCNSGDVKGDNRENELFINNGDLTFSERAHEFGIDDRGLSTHGVFFDYDKDGDLDLYLLNNSYRAIGSFNLQRNERVIRDSLGGDKLFRNNSNKFKDVSDQAGIYGSIIGFGLGVTIGDVNDDDWEDIYISNDFFERDYLYINQKNGTFKECLEEQMKCTSSASMGADMADINNDTYPDIFVTDMLPRTNERLKTKTTFENWDRHQFYLKNGYYHQFTRNTLQLNNGNSTFSEIGRLSGVDATDWSWGALIADLNNDGLKDLFVANGIYQDLTDQDFLNFMASEETQKAVITKKGVDFKKLIDYIPSIPISNYAFSNDGNLQFSDVSASWGLNTPGFSNGSAYGDLDNDGDLDLVVNNVNMPSFIYRNETNSQFGNNKFLKLILHGEEKNTNAVGAKVFIHDQGKTQYLEQMPMRGFESSIDPRPNFGLGNVNQIDSVIVKWPTGKITVLSNVKANQTLNLFEKEGLKNLVLPHQNNSIMFKDITSKQSINYKHIENDFVDFDRDRLIYHMLSSEGPKACQGDINGDGLDDFYIGNAKDTPGSMFLQLPNGKFKSVNQELFEQDKLSEDTDCVLFDADNDNDLDLFVGSGGNEFPSSSTALISRLYLNDGKGKFSKSIQPFPALDFESVSCVKAGDYDADGDLDLLVGIRLRPFLYGVPVNAYILNNNGKGKFENVTDQIAPGLHNVGMITDVLWQDIDQDKDLDIIIVGEWMPIKIFKNQGGKFTDVTSQSGLSKSNGWWNCIQAVDFDHDNDIDFVVGNHGLNSRFKASDQKPMTFYVNDFDGNGSAEQIVCMYNGDRSYPLALKHDLVVQLPSLKKKYLEYSSYKDQGIEDIFSKEQLKKSVKHEVFTLETSLLVNTGNGTFELKPLPVEAQFSPVYGMMISDFDHDGNEDIVLGGNLYRAKPEVGRYDASYGCFLKGDGHGNFKSVNPVYTGMVLEGEVRDMMLINVNKEKLLFVARNNDAIQILKCK